MAIAERKRIIQVLGALAIAGAGLFVIVNWPQILEAYYKHQLDSADEEAAWGWAAKLGTLRSEHAEDWYRVQLDNPSWDERVRAARGLAAIPTDSAIASVFQLRKPVPSLAAAGTGINVQALSFLSLGPGWTLEETEHAVTILSDRLAGTNGQLSMKQAGLLLLTANSSGRAQHEAVITELNTSAEILEQAGPETRAVLDQLAEQEQDLSIRMHARVIRRLIPNPLPIPASNIISN